VSDLSGSYGAWASPQTIDAAHGGAVVLEIIIPALNEAQRIGPTLQEVYACLKQLPFTCMITVVDNGSADATADIVKSFGGGDVAVRLIGCRHRGKGAAVKAGVMASTAQWIGFLDADLATPMAALETVLIELQAGAGRHRITPSRRSQLCGVTARRTSDWLLGVPTDHPLACWRSDRHAVRLQIL